MPRPLVWVPGVVLSAVAIAALLILGASREPAAGRSAPRVVVRSPAAPAPASGAARDLSRSGAPEVVVLGDLAPARVAPTPAPARRSASARPRAIHEIVYVDAPAAEAYPEPISMESPAAEPVRASTAVEPAPVSLPPVASVPPSAPVPTPRGSSRAGAIVTGAAIGAGVGAVLGGGRGALRGAIGGAAGGAIGGRSGAVLGGVLGGASGRGRAPRRGGCYTGSTYELVSATP
jgi:hypothetical protein